jgi:L,D-peptidoglycan transpeptidase YkuD (ErfK/YbiS/YcfS/YnhG family)
MANARHIILGITIAGALAAVAYRAVGHAAPAMDCPPAKAIAIVDTSRHVLTMCDAGVIVGQHSVRIGKNGVGKTAEGDGKTPLGTYPLGPPRASAEYGTFIPIDYPTAEQRRTGFTGSAIGIHGPMRHLRWAGRFVNLVDTTDGCVGIATDEEMLQLEHWIRVRNVPTILLR